MTSYVARTGGRKKKNILVQREAELRAALQHDESEAKIERIAEKVRSAQMGLVKALLAESKPVRDEDERKVAETLSALSEQRSYWADIPVADIVRLYSNLESDHPVVERKKYWDFRPR